MALSKGQKFKMLRLLELLETETSPGKPLTMTAICEELTHRDVFCDRRTLSKDILQLREQGYVIHSVFIGHEKAYFMDNEQLSVAESVCR